MIVMAIETSCDETACAIVKDGWEEISSVVASSSELHKITGGIVPEVAARKQAEYIIPVIELCLQKASLKLGVEPKNVKHSIDYIAVTKGPGLVGSLIVGIEAAKTLAMAWNKPIIPVNHLLGHIYANYLGRPTNQPILPAVALVVSGGHTDLIYIKNHNDMKYLGGTIDDAAGEAFDKVARLLGMGSYLGGVTLANNADLYAGPKLTDRLPRPLINEPNYNFSFSGLKTAVKRLSDKGSFDKNAIAREFQEAIVDTIVRKTVKAVIETKAQSLLIGGGVSANRYLRERFEEEVKTKLVNTSLYIPPLRLCTDNALYIASAAYFLYKNKTGEEFQNVQPDPSLSII